MDNIAIKVPSYQFDQIVLFYKVVLELEQIDKEYPDSYESVAFRFGDKTLWIDKIPSISQAEIWLEIKTDSVERAAGHFENCNITRQDDIEELPKDLRGFWISSPANIIHLISETE